MSFHLIRLVPSIAAMLVVALLALPAQATSLLRDADMEHALKQISAPILRAAGLNPNRVKILVVNEATLNAFVVSNDAIFVHYGLINKMQTATMLQGIIAHEAAHIANGHIARRLGNLSNARTISGLGIALAAAAAAAGNSRAAGGIALGTSTSAQRAFLSHTRAEEASADQSGVRYMKAAGASPQGLFDALSIFAGQETLSAGRQDPYMRSHPLSRDRMRAVAGYVASYGTLPKDETAEYWFARLKGKITAYTRAPSWTLRRLNKEPYPDVRLLREAVALHRNSKTKKALAAIDSAIAARPYDAFLRDQKGQIQLETRNFAAAANTYASAVKYAPNDPLVLSGYGRALLAAGQVKKSLGVLEKSRRQDYRDGSMLRDLATAYAKTGQQGMAALITAERFALGGRLKDAGIHARRASGLLSQGSGPWQRAQDVLIASQRAAKRK
ncbi:M48 family metalloprotease [Sulfitobacter donghicola]|uniref:Peptidase M48 n=1 Tax=Sulfitobacter donghicola DSW-25 = KCTC 12864 = JCM 14565 TaxID=1300350 RepID=A0A073IRC3_9RHOB|nr:M48 family metalloprotease [Sulfitobacter donghicola]KEJ87952.1 peptidase M48 [Sulfitobacter donghicola DSW-25 = KCTC 12864 = JCM 14565]KIN66516.1 Peptidase, M48 family [Sulfitobacter donghicola DSW-25 = KCTC 12864 = JCM 14565]